MKLLGCAFGGLLISLPLLSPLGPARAASETVLYSFCNSQRLQHCPDGSEPLAGLTDVRGKLYGTTWKGGRNVGLCEYGCGTVFALDPKTGAESFVYKFFEQHRADDGESPEAGVIQLGGRLYGTTIASGNNGPKAGSSRYGCGEYGCGTVFSVDLKTNKEKLLYAFCSQVNCSDGASPQAGLIEMNGTLYGTTSNGGNGGGVVFAFDPSTDKETVLYSFCSQQKCTDGNSPRSGLLNVNGTLYGTTIGGGNAGASFCGSGCGTVFSLNPGTGMETVLYTFCSQNNCSDGALPEAGLINVNGVLYGTTGSGGDTGSSCSGGCGVVFELDPGTGKESTLYTFCHEQNCPDGAFPFASLIAVKGVLYGTTVDGGNGGGVIFAVDPKIGAETLVHSFLGGTDGASPFAALIEVKGTLFGTTMAGGTNDGGTVYSVVP
jgi:uncharacterized repeat protein (TIGR03803 family)